LEFGPGWDLVGLSTDHPVNLEGRHSPTAAVRVVDEAKAVPAAVFESTEALLDAPESLDVWISTPSIPDGPFYSRDIKGGPDVIRAVVTIDDLIAEGLPGKAEWKAARLAEWGENSPEFESRCMARYVSDAEGALFPYAWVARAMSADFDVDLPPVAGLDVAGSVAGDETALALLAGPNDLGQYRVQSVNGWHERDTQVSKGRALLACRSAGAPVLRIDVVGLGKGLSDSIRTDFPGVEEFRASDRAGESERFVNRKAEVSWEARRLLEAGLFRLPQSAKLKAQLLGMRYQITAQGKIRVLDPSDSPDYADAVLIALAGEAPYVGSGWIRLAEKLIAQKAAEARGETGSASSPVPPPPSWRRLDARLWEFAEPELMDRVVAEADRRGQAIERNGQQIRLPDTDSAKAFDTLVCGLSPPPPPLPPGFGLSTEVVSARSLEAIDIIRAGGSLPGPSTSLTTAGMRATLAQADARGVMAGSVRPRQSDPLDQLRDDYVALARKWGYTR
jgi:hypothetical protein